MAMSYRTIPISDLADISNIPIANEPADFIDFTKQTETPATTTTPQTRYDLRSRQGPRSRIASTNFNTSVNNPNNNRESPRPLRIATPAAPSSDSQEPTRPQKRPRTRTRTRTRTCSSGSGSGSGGVQVHDVTTLRDITGRNVDFDSCSACNQWYAMVYRKVVAQMIDVLEEREVERFLCAQDIHEDVKDDDIVMMVCS